MNQTRFISIICHIIHLNIDSFLIYKRWANIQHEDFSFQKMNNLYESHISFKQIRYSILPLHNSLISLYFNLSGPDWSRVPRGHWQNHERPHKRPQHGSNHYQTFASPAGVLKIPIKQPLPDLFRGRRIRPLPPIRQEAGTGRGGLERGRGYEL